MKSKKYIHGSSQPEQERLAQLNYLTNESFISFLELKPEENILELGSGLGILAEQVSKKLLKGKVTGIEISEEQLQKCPPSGKKLQFVKGDVHAPPFPAMSFDRIYCRYILEHLSNPAQALTEAFKILKPGGEIFIQENSILLIEFYPPCPKFKKAWRKFSKLQKMLGGDAMIGIKFHSLLVRAGFKNIELSLAPEIHWYGKTSFEPWIRNIIMNVEGAVKELVRMNLATLPELQEAISELEEFIGNPLASSYFYWNRAKALK